MNFWYSISPISACYIKYSEFNKTMILRVTFSFKSLYISEQQLIHKQIQLIQNKLQNYVGPNFSFHQQLQ